MIWTGISVTAWIPPSRMLEFVDPTDDSSSDESGDVETSFYSLGAFTGLPPFGEEEPAQVSARFFFGKES